MTNQKPKIFLSYAHENIDMAKRIYQDLKRYGLDVWFDNESLLPGQDWNFEIEQAIEKSKFFLAVISSKSIDKVGYIQKEVKTALEKLKHYPKNKSYILPIRLNDCKPLDKEIKALHWIDVFPEAEYLNGLKKILQVVSPETFLLRSKPMKLSDVDVNAMIIRHGFYETYRNPGGKGCSHQYKLQEINGDKIIFDEISRLMWQQSGSSEEMKFEDAKKCIDELNEKRFAGFNDWRLPTLEEAMSLMEPKEKNNRYINPVFDKEQYWIWTADQVQGKWRAWVVGFRDGGCGNNPFYATSFSYGRYVRAVRYGQSS